MRPIPKQTTLTQSPFCSLPRSRSSRLVSSRFTSSLASATPPVISRSAIPHILVYALGNYPFPLSRHSLPQSLLPLILERYRSSSTGIKKATGNKEQRGGCLKLLKKHECWIGGGLVDLHRDPYEMQQARNSPQSFEVSPGSALLTIVKPSMSTEDPCRAYQLKAYHLVIIRGLDEHSRTAATLPPSLWERTTARTIHHRSTSRRRYRFQPHSFGPTRLARNPTNDIDQTKTQRRTTGTQRTPVHRGLFGDPGFLADWAWHWTTFRRKK